MSDNNSPVHLLPPRQPSRGPLAFWSALDPAIKIVLQLAALVSVIGAAVGVYNSVATDGELAVMRSAQAQVDQAQGAAIAAVDGDAELLFQTTVKITTDVDWLKQEVSGIRRDLRDMDRGRPLAPLPVVTPTPGPAQPAPRPTP